MKNVLRDLIILICLLTALHVVFAVYTYIFTGTGVFILTQTFGRSVAFWVSNTIVATALCAIKDFMELKRGEAK